LHSFKEYHPVCSITGTRGRDRIVHWIR
jgi:hypothetical protein